MLLAPDMKGMNEIHQFMKPLHAYCFPSKATGSYQVPA